MAINCVLNDREVDFIQAQCEGVIGMARMLSSQGVNAVPPEQLSMVRQLNVKMQTSPKVGTDDNNVIDLHK